MQMVVQQLLDGCVYGTMQIWTLCVDMVAAKSLSY